MGKKPKRPGQGPPPTAAQCRRCQGSQRNARGGWCSCVPILMRLLISPPRTGAELEPVRREVARRPRRLSTREVMDATGGRINRVSMPQCENPRCGRIDRPLTVRRGKAVCLGGCV